MKKLTFIVLLLLHASLLFAQNFIKGYLRNAETQEAIPYANIVVKGKTIGGTTNSNGYFNIPIKSSFHSDTLGISSIGFTKLEVPIRKLSKYLENELVLLPATEELDMLTIKAKMPTLKEIVKYSSQSFKKDIRKKQYLGEFYYAEAKYTNDDFQGGMESTGEIYFENYNQIKADDAHKWSYHILMFDHIKRNKDYNWNYNNWDHQESKSENRLNNKYAEGHNIVERNLRNLNFMGNQNIFHYQQAFIKNGPLVNPSNYKFELEEMLVNDDQLVYVLSFLDQKKNGGKGLLYLTEEYDLLKVTSEDLRPIQKYGNFTYDNVPIFKNRLYSKGEITFTKVGETLYTDHIDFEMTYKDTIDVIKYVGKLNIPNFSTIECYNLRNATIFRFSDKGFLLQAENFPYVGYSCSYWGYNTNISSELSNIIDSKNILMDSTLYQKEQKIRKGLTRYGYDKKRHQQLTPEMEKQIEDQKLFHYYTSRNLLHRSAYDDLIITENKENKVVLKDEFNKMTKLSEYDQRKVTKEVMDSLRYSISFHTQLNRMSKDFHHQKEGLSLQGFQELSTNYMKQFVDTLMVYKPLLSDQYAKTMKGNILGLWLNINAIYAEANPEIVKTQAPHLLLNALNYFDLDDPEMNKSDLHYLIAEHINIHLTFIENDNRLFADEAPFNENKNTVERFQDINNKYIKNKALNEKVLSTYLKEYYFYNDTVQNATFSNSVTYFQSQFPQSEYQADLDQLIAQRGGFNQNEKVKSIEGLDVQFNSTPIDCTEGVHVIDIWASWCGPCVISIRDHYPVMLQKYEKEGVKFHFVSLDKGNNKWLKSVEKFATDYKNHHIKINDQEINHFKKKFGVRGIPLVLIIKDGKLIKRMSGFREEVLIKELDFIKQ
ncbi:carboxypeptidase-like regulatory domain-containing protein [Flammeovirga sp. EKP202]|uniref:carboxypeptidase-like regulatory domain-containing protein n=1 Tax=Flammeovirga sp. EKP202 TaxID=2770592 RepID=UPI00165F6709|nr:carboxypeptidase-like regulatory domain-containing protein [Flammeovirga sp. EKP202]MBD0403970.1 carboxypeptidase-like regulatory domain-containing protein [Flammeovirga sp. EKP202]